MFVDFADFFKRRDMVGSINLHRFILLFLSLSFHHRSFLLLEEVDRPEESALLLCWNVSTVHHGAGKPRTSLAVLAWYENGHYSGVAKFEGYFRCNSNAATNCLFCRNLILESTMVLLRQCKVQIKSLGLIFEFFQHEWVFVFPTNVLMRCAFS